MTGGKADPTAARLRIEVRRALAHEVGQPEQTVAAGGRRGCFRHERIVVRIRRQAISEPLQTKTRSLCHAHHVPFLRHSVAESVNPAQRIV